MTAKIKTKDVDRGLYVNYLQRAHECLAAARSSLAGRAWNASAINALHCAIAACDALCVYTMGKRYAGDDHRGAVALLNTIRDDKGAGEQATRFGRLLAMKNVAEYEERLVRQNEAEKIMKDTERFIEHVLKKLPPPERSIGDRT